MYNNNTMAVFLDRDNTINIDNGYTYKPEDFKWTHETPRALRLFKLNHIPVFVITNQSGIGRGYFTENQVMAFHSKLIRETNLEGGSIQDIVFCPHHPDAVVKKYKFDCDCRKPKPGMILKLAKKWGINLSKSFLIGDQNSDIQAGKAAGCTTFLIKENANLFYYAKKIIKEKNINNQI